MDMAFGRNCVFYLYISVYLTLSMQQHFPTTDWDYYTNKFSAYLDGVVLYNDLAPASRQRFWIERNYGIEKQA